MLKWLLGIFVGVILIAVIAYTSSHSNYSYRYRLGLTISIDNTNYVGSSVIEVKWECGPRVADSGRCGPSLGGQAALVDLGSRGVVVATLRTGENITPVPDGAVDAVWLCANAFGNHSTNEELPGLERLQGRRDLSPSNFPRLVWFANPADVKSAQKITVENMAQALGPGARFTEAFVEITRDPIVIDIESKLPWLPELRRLQREGKLPSVKTGQFKLVYNMFVGENS